MSIIKKISLLFILSFVLMLTIGFWIDSINSKRINILINDKYQKVANELFTNIDNQTQFNALIKAYKLRKTHYKEDDNKEILYYKELTFGHISIEKKSFEDEFIIQIKYLDELHSFQTPDEENIKEKITLNALIFLDVFVLLLIFLYILKLLSPLKKITKEIKNFANGDLSTRVEISSNDEIGTLGKTFNAMASNLENLIKTREELLRDIGHELRTPIAKGKFAIEKIDDFSQKKLLKKIFSDLEILTNELIQLEKLNSTQLNLTTFRAETLIVESLQKLYIQDESKIHLEILQDFKIQGDLDYLSIALKNLIDNALKYALELPIHIKVFNHEISVCNKGAKLSKELEYYLKPFTQELSQRDGFGLGLSIVNKIIDKHGFQLLYSHENGFNIFKITL
ncbi:MAG: ArsS family sensor histidine kinase [Candidatus Marinarcus sp.]|uniref:ArsS family sensor histidine kinase n=1 Tax=Candidatus Marinarcus sp. TaxID=3100987 RepID=UPI003B00C9CB